MDHTTCWLIIGALATTILGMGAYIKLQHGSHLRDLREINGMSGGKHGHKE